MYYFYSFWKHLDHNFIRKGCFQAQQFNSRTNNIMGQHVIPKVHLCVFVLFQTINMLQTFQAVAKNFKLKPQAYNIDNLVFKFHYRFTTIILFVATILVTSRQYIGEHIRCISDGGVPEHVMNTFCFFTATFTVVKLLFLEVCEKA